MQVDILRRVHLNGRPSVRDEDSKTSEQTTHHEETKLNKEI
jgi:hypothetical protein